MPMNFLRIGNTFVRDVSNNFIKIDSTSNPEDCSCCAPDFSCVSMPRYFRVTSDAGPAYSWTNSFDIMLDNQDTIPGDASPTYVDTTCTRTRHIISNPSPPPADEQVYLAYANLNMAAQIVRPVATLNIPDNEVGFFVRVAYYNVDIGEGQTMLGYSTITLDSSGEGSMHYIDTSGIPGRVSFTIEFSNTPF